MGFVYPFITGGGHHLVVDGMNGDLTMNGDDDRSTGVPTLVAVLFTVLANELGWKMEM